MMNKLYLHIGTTKTGTTALQKFLINNKEIIEKSGYCYPAYTKTNEAERDYSFIADDVYKNQNGMRIVDIYIKAFFKTFCRSVSEHGGTSSKDKDLVSTTNADFFLMDKKTADYLFEEINLSDVVEEWDDFIAGINKLLENSNVIYSSELLWQVPKQGIKKLYQCFGDRMEVIIYMRRQDRLVESYWNEMISGNLLYAPFEKFVPLTKQIPNFGWIYDYKLWTDYLESFMKKSSIHIRPFRKTNKDGSHFNVVRDFLDFAGISIDPELIKEPVYVNNHLAGMTVEYMRVICKTLQDIGCDEKISKKYIDNYLKMSSKITNQNADDYYFEPEARVGFLKQFEDYNKYLSEEYFGGEVFDDEGATPGKEPSIHTMTKEEEEIFRQNILLSLSASGLQG